MRTKANYGIVGVVQSVSGSNTGVIVSSVDHVLLKKSNSWLGVPGAPTSVSATLSGNDVIVNFTAPVNNGGFTITNYIVTASSGGITSSGSSSPITVTGLTAGTTYTFNVMAINSSGSSNRSSESNSITIPISIPISLLVVAGGGSGYMGGGGAGGLLIGTVTFAGGQSHIITIGAGGSSLQNPGSNTSISGTSVTAIAIGGGCGDSPIWDSGLPRTWQHGGSGGGSGYPSSSVTPSTGGTALQTNSGGLTGYGNNGGGGVNGSQGSGGGGGGAGAVGGTSYSSTVDGAGGAGREWPTGSGTYYAGGGGGAGYGATTVGAGGVGGGAAGNNGAGNSGTVNTGGGGGGSQYSYGGSPGSGGSGVVILRYSDTYPALTSTTGSPTYTVSGGYRTYKFTSSGTFYA